MRIISRAGEELASDALSVAGYEMWGCNDYSVVEVSSSEDIVGLSGDTERSYVVLSPRDLVRIRPRDRKDHVQWLVEKERYEEALNEMEKIEAEEAALGVKTSLPPAAAAASSKGKEAEGGEEEEGKTGKGRPVHLTSQEIGQMFIEHLVHDGLSLSTSFLELSFCLTLIFPLL